MRHCLILLTCIILLLTGCARQIPQTTIDFGTKDPQITDAVTEPSVDDTTVENAAVTEPPITTEEITSDQIIEDEIPAEFSIQLSFAGDCMLACSKNQTTSGSFNEYTDKYEADYFLEKVRDIFEADDFTLVNLENVLSDKELTPIEKNYERSFWFMAQTSNINILRSGGVEAASVANNHTGDYGTAGYNDTVEAVESAGLLCGTDDNTIYFEKEGFRIAFICCTMWYDYTASSISKRIKAAEEVSDYQVVYFHGGTENIHELEDWKVNAARKLVDNGADLVIGGHPHVLQPREIYNGVEIVYSLGNFCYGGHRQPENRSVIYQMNLTINRETMTVTKSESNIIPCYVYTKSVNNYQPAVIEDEDVKQRVLDFMDGKIDSPV